MLNLMDMPGYRKAFKAIKSLITDVSETHKDQRRIAGIASANQPTAELALETETADNLPELISGWRGELMAEALHNLCGNIHSKSSEAGLGALSATSGKPSKSTPGVYPSHANSRYFSFGWHALHR